MLEGFSKLQRRLCARVEKLGELSVFADLTEQTELKCQSSER